MQQNRTWSMPGICITPVLTKQHFPRKPVRCVVGARWQTCVLPRRRRNGSPRRRLLMPGLNFFLHPMTAKRSEERRVGKECRYGGRTWDRKKKKKKKSDVK